MEVNSFYRNAIIEQPRLEWTWKGHQVQLLIGKHSLHYII